MITPRILQTIMYILEENGAGDIQQPKKQSVPKYPKQLNFVSLQTCIINYICYSELSFHSDILKYVASICEFHGKKRMKCCYFCIDHIYGTVSDNIIKMG